MKEKWKWRSHQRRRRHMSLTSTPCKGSLLRNLLCPFFAGVVSLDIFCLLMGMEVSESQTEYILAEVDGIGNRRVPSSAITARRRYQCHFRNSRPLFFVFFVNAPSRDKPSSLVEERQSGEEPNEISLVTFKHSLEAINKDLILFTLL